MSSNALLAMPFQQVINDFYQFLKDCASTVINFAYNTITVKDDDPLYSIIIEEIKSQCKSNYYHANAKGTMVDYKPGLGRYKITVQGCELCVKLCSDRIEIYKYRLPDLINFLHKVVKLCKDKSLSDIFSIIYSESIAHFYIQNSNVIKKSLQDIQNNYQGPANFISFYQPADDMWRFVAARKYRNLDSANFTPEMNQFLKSVDEFTKAKETFIQQGRHYRKGYLITGSPGTGKTSSVEIIATKYEMPIYTINISWSTMTNAHFSNLVKTIPPKSILLFDEFDKQAAAILTGKKKVTFDEVLSSIAGIIPISEGSIVIMTANQKDFLPDDRMAELTRPGRIDETFQFNTKYN